MTVGVRPAVVHRIDHTGQCMKVLLGIFRIVLVWVKVARNATHTDAPSHFFLIYSFSSMVGMRGNRGQLVYSATKGAVIALTKSAAKELAPKNIRVNSIAPGITQTAMMEQADLDKLEGRINNICMGRIAQPRDIAGGCLLVASDYAGYISGQVLATA